MQSVEDMRQEAALDSAKETAERMIKEKEMSLEKLHIIYHCCQWTI